MPGLKTEEKAFEKKGRNYLSFYQKLINHAFSPMNLGLLTIHLPDGQKLQYGSGNNGVEAEIYVRNNDFFKKCVFFGDVGFGESYVDGDWETDDITKVVEWMILNVENHPTLMSDTKKRRPVNFLKILNNIRTRFRQNTLLGSRKNISEHYDLGNDFFELFLDRTMTYSSAYFKTHDQGLDEAQVQKIDGLCQKLRLKASDHVLEIGSGWGSFAVHAAKNYGCRVTTVTISERQFQYVKNKIREEGAESRIDVQFKDYRDIEGKYDKIVSIEMIEAVGHQYYDSFFLKCHQLLRKDGLLALQMILAPDHRYDSFRKNTDWIQKYIFPGSLLPSVSIIQRSITRTGTLCLFDFADMTPHYVKTLAIWRRNFNQSLDKVQALGLDEPFIRKWKYYLSYCEAAFKMRNISVAQAVFTMPNNLQLS